MKASEGRVGRVFVIRLEHGDIIPDCIERFAEEKKISVGQVIMIGGIGEGQVVSDLDVRMKCHQNPCLCLSMEHMR